MRKILLAFIVALGGAIAARPQSTGSPNNQLEGTWELVSGQQLPEGSRDVKIISRGHFIFVAYNKNTGEPLYTGGGTYTLNGTSYTEHVDFMSDQISTGMIGKDQPFSVQIEGDKFIQTGVRSSGQSLKETWKRVD